MSAYYNEFDPYAAQWLRNLIAAGHIALGDVDERSILEVKPDDLRGYTQCHFFAGIGGWSEALHIAGWADDRPVWTGSCPCQPFSAAGKQRGSSDERHLWPAFFRLISECRPSSVFGEQVAGAAGLAWLDHVAADLEDAGYAAAAANIGAHSVGAPHLRQRLYWVAHTDGRHASAERQQRSGEQRQQPAHGGTGALAHADGARSLDGEHGTDRRRASSVAQRSSSGGLADATDARPQGREPAGQRVDAQRQAAERASPLDHWADLAWIECSDGKARPTQRSIFPLAHGLPGGGVAISSAVPDTEGSEAGERVFSRVGVLRGAGNAIVPQVAAAFVMAAA